MKKDIEWKKPNLIYINIDLQIFADDDKTEKATDKKKEDARKKGQVFHSKELSAGLLLLGTVLGFKFFGSYMYTRMQAFFYKVIQEYVTRDNPFGFPELMVVFTDFLITLLSVMLPLFSVIVLVAVSVELAQIGFLFTTEPIGMKFDKINPMKGFKRIFSLNTLVELIKSILKILIVGSIAYFYLKQESMTIISLINLDVLPASIIVMDITINVAIRMAVAFVVLGIIDFIYQKWSYEKSLRMSKKEIKDEYKQQEGNPEIKAKIKQKQREISMRRMMQEVPNADVVITNPTHYAVAIKYDLKKSDAPVVIAKGKDYIALRIKEIAKENKVEIVENKPLARALFETVDIGRAVPQDLYQAVAEVLAFVYSLKGKINAS